MKTTKIITLTLLLAALATGCNKENNGRIRIASENMTRGDNAKVLINPSNPAETYGWLNEPINLNGTVYTVSGDVADGFYLVDASNNEVSAPGGDMYALYLGDDYDGNDVTVTNTDTKREIVLNKLVIKFPEAGKQSVAFPMAAKTTSGNLLLFHHLCAGFIVTLHNSSSSAVSLRDIKILAQGENNNTLDTLGFTARWAVQGLSIPTGLIGGNTDDVDVKYMSEMNMTIDGGTTIAAGADFTFMVPVTISNVKRLVVYGTDGLDCETPVFNVSKTFSSAINVQRNRMYTLPTISF